ncbi:MAG: hypothetical protein MJY60_04620 [Bacteroidales bacterium]|nr:hypothetical protein [Bacteroidales bacterium]
MRRYFTMIAAMAALLIPVTSCQRADVDRLFGKETSFTLKISCPSDEDTKTGLDGLQPYWKSGDKIWISDGTNSTMATVPARCDGWVNAEVEVSGLDSTKILYALYPYDENASVSSGKIIMNINPIQDGLFSSAHHMSGIKNPDDQYMKLSNACAIIKFTANREDLLSMQLYNPSIKFVGQYKVDPATGAKSGAVNALNTVNMDFNKRIGEHYLAVYAGSLPSKSRFTFITKDGRIGHIITTKSNSLKAGYLYDMGTIDDLIVFDGDPATDLSSVETANCYITRGAGTYRLKTVQGNSSTSVGKAAMANVIWETVNTATAPAVGSIVSEAIYSNSYLYFRIPESAPDGNALLAACDQNGKVLWSWHIWNLKDGVTDQVYTGTSYSGATMMDRNLGALSAEPGTDAAVGFFYQYGRKDPFMSTASHTGNKTMVAAGTAQKTTASNAETGTVEYATANPTTVIYKSSAAWHADEDAVYWSSKKKTKYDPCPPGYQIPSEAVYAGFTKSNVKWDDTNKGRTITLSSKNIWFPATGYRSSGSGNLSSCGGTGYIWYDEATSAAGYNSQAISSSKFTGYTSGHASCFALRCQKNTISGEAQTIVMKYNVEDVLNYVAAPYTNDKIFAPIYIVWGSGDPEEYSKGQMIFHRFDAPGTYSLLVECHDVNEFTIDPIGDLEIIDLTSF